MAKHPFKKPGAGAEAVKPTAQNASMEAQPVAGAYRCGAQNEGRRCYLHVGHEGGHDFGGEKLEPWGPAPQRFDPMAQADVGPTLEEQERVTDEMMKERLAGRAGAVELTREDLEQAFKDYEAAAVTRQPLERRDALEMLRLMKVGMGLVLVQTGHTAYIPEIDQWQSAVEKLIGELGGAA